MVYLLNIIANIWNNKFVENNLKENNCKLMRKYFQMKMSIFIVPSGILTIYFTITHLKSTQKRLKLNEW